MILDKLNIHKYSFDGAFVGTIKLDHQMSKFHITISGDKIVIEGVNNDKWNRIFYDQFPRA